MRDLQYKLERLIRLGFEGCFGQWECF